MILYKKIYAGFFGISPDDRVPCERCIMLNLLGLKHGVSEAVDIHHCSARGAGGDPQRKKDKIENLGGVCRECHDELEKDPNANALFSEWCANKEVRKVVMDKFLFGEGEKLINQRQT